MSHIVSESGRVIDGTGKAPAQGYSVIIKDGKIEKGGRTEGSFPTGAKRISMSGLTVMPGLVDLHLHLSHSDAPTRTR